MIWVYSKIFYTFQIFTVRIFTFIFGGEEVCFKKQKSTQEKSFSVSQLNCMRSHFPRGNIIKKMSPKKYLPKEISGIERWIY